MRHQDRPRRGSGLPALAILIGMLCAGIIGMHQLAGGDHHAGTAMTMSPDMNLGASGSTPATGGAAMSRDEPTETGRAAGAEPSESQATVLTFLRSVDEATGGAGGACMTALLVGLLVLLVRNVGWTTAREPCRRTGPARTGGPRPGRGPPRNLLAQLCVMRI